MPLYGNYESITTWIFQRLNQSVRRPRNHDQVLPDTFYSLMMMAVHDNFASLATSDNRLPSLSVTLCEGRSLGTPWLCWIEVETCEGMS